MGAFDPTVIAVSVAISGLALLILIVAAYMEHREDEQEPAVEAVLTDDDHLALWTQEMWPGRGSYAQQVDEASWLRESGAWS